MNPINTIAACAALIAAATPAPADDGTARQRTFGNGVLSEYLAIYDVDNSGGLSREELQALEADKHNLGRHQKFRNRWDSNHDGRISIAERDAARTQIRQAILLRRSARFDSVDQYDQDGRERSDGFLNRTEFFAISAVSATDLATPGTGDRLFLHLDKNGDSLISKDEFLRSLDAVRPVGTEPTPTPIPHQETSNP